MFPPPPPLSFPLTSLQLVVPSVLKLQGVKILVKHQCMLKASEITSVIFLMLAGAVTLSFVLASFYKSMIMKRSQQNDMPE